MWMYWKRNSWGLSTGLDNNDERFYGPELSASGSQVPTNRAGSWAAIYACRGTNSMPVNVAISRSNCYDCGLNKIKSPNSNICMCRSGQFPGSNNVCINCLTNTYKDSHSDNPCTSCSIHSTSPSGSTSISNCICNAGFSGEPGTPCIQCDGGKYSN